MWLSVRGSVEVHDREVFGCHGSIPHALAVRHELQNHPTEENSERATVERVGW